MNNCCKSNCKLIKKYDPKPKNSDGSIKWFLYRWDDGKNGYRKLVMCRECGSFYLVQCYRLNKFSADADMLYEDWHAVDNEVRADWLNKNYTGIKLEHSMKEVYRKCCSNRRFSHIKSRIDVSNDIRGRYCRKLKL